MAEKIVILGGGFAGVRAALNLSKSLKEEEITLISNTSFHCYIPDLYELSTVPVKKDTKSSFEEIFNTVNIPLREIFRSKGVKILIDRVETIDLSNKKVSTSDSGRVDYDYLVVALGSETSYYGIEGAWEYSHPIKTTEDALNIRNDLQELLATAVEKKRKLEVVIAGGGFTGVELASQLQRFFGKKGKVTILEAADNLLTGMPPWAQKVALERLRILGVAVNLGEKILKVEEVKVVCSSKNYNFDYLIWTTGVKGVSLRSVPKGAEFNPKSQFVLTEHLNLPNHPEVFVCGDVAQVGNVVLKKFTPPAAWAAIGESKIVARNLASLIKNKKLSKYNPPNPAFVVPLGGNFAVSNALSFHWIGFSPWFVKQFIALRYFLSILPVNKALAVWWRGARI